MPEAWLEPDGVRNVKTAMAGGTSLVAQWLRIRLPGHFVDDGCARASAGARREGTEKTQPRVCGFEPPHF